MTSFFPGFYGWLIWMPACNKIKQIFSGESQNIHSILWGSRRYAQFLWSYNVHRVWLDSIAVSVFEVILVQFYKFWIWDVFDTESETSRLFYVWFHNVHCEWKVWHGIHPPDRPKLNLRNQGPENRSETCVRGGGRAKKQEKIWRVQVAAEIAPHFLQILLLASFIWPQL